MDSKRRQLLHEAAALGLAELAILGEIRPVWPNMSCDVIAERSER